MFITFEGPDGAGKSTQLRLLSAYLAARRLSLLITREPGGTTIGEHIRQLLHDRQYQEMQPLTEIFLFSAARAQLVAEKLRHHLAAGGVVLCDRYTDSTLAYQGYGRGLALDMLRPLIAWSTANLTPDLTLLFDLDVAEGLRRRQSSGEEGNRLEDCTLDFHRRVRQGYRELAQAEPQRWVVLNAARPVDLIQAEVRQIVTERLRQRGYALDALLPHP